MSFEDFPPCGSITRHSSCVGKKRDKQATKAAEATFQVRVLSAEQMAALNILPNDLALGGLTTEQRSRVRTR